MGPRQLPACWQQAASSMRQTACSSAGCCKKTAWWWPSTVRGWPSSARDRLSDKNKFLKTIIEQTAQGCLSRCPGPLTLVPLMEGGGQEPGRHAVIGGHEGAHVVIGIFVDVPPCAWSAWSAWNACMSP